MNTGLKEEGIPVLYSEDKSVGNIHLHVFQKGHPEIFKHIAFRDYLNQNPNSAKEYENLKKELHLKFKNDREKYTNSKNEFIQSVLNIVTSKNENVELHPSSDGFAEL